MPPRNFLLDIWVNNDIALAGGGGAAVGQSGPRDGTSAFDVEEHIVLRGAGGMGEGGGEYDGMNNVLRAWLDGCCTSPITLLSPDRTALMPSRTRRIRVQP